MENLRKAIENLEKLQDDISDRINSTPEILVALSEFSKDGLDDLIDYLNNIADEVENLEGELEEAKDRIEELEKEIL